MNYQVIPSLLQSKLQERMSSEFTSPSIIEVGNKAVSIAVEQSQNIAQFLKTSNTSKSQLVASEPSVLLLLSQEKLEDSLSKSAVKNLTLLSETQSPRQDLSVLSDESVVLATTPQRAIDHIRRDNIFLSQTKAVVLAYSFDRTDEETDEQFHFREQAFLDDCRFVFTKLNPNTHIELFVDSLSHLRRTPQELLEQPTIIAQVDWERPQLTIQCYAVSPKATDTILDILHVMQEQRYMVVYKDDKEWRRLERRLRNSIPRMEITKISLDRLDTMRKTQNEHAATMVAIGLDSGETITLIRHINEWDYNFQRVVCITTPQHADEILTSKETLLMKNEKKSIPETNEVLSGKIQMLVAKLAIDSNPEELEVLRKLVKKNVPFHRRGYFTAYLLRELLGSDKRSTGNASITKSSATPKVAETVNESKSEKPQRIKRQSAKENNQVTPEGARTLYLNIGKMRRLYAKELSQILQDQLGITREDIFSLRIHDKYSFITLSQENAEKAIEKMNGMDIRGRTAAITYSNKE